MMLFIQPKMPITVDKTVDTEIILPFVLLDKSGRIVPLPEGERVSLEDIFVFEGYSGDITKDISWKNMSLKDLNNWLTKKMGLDMRRFGYTKPSRDIIQKYLGKLPKGDISNAIKALNTINVLLKVLDKESQEFIIERLLNILSDYTGLGGSRDQAPFLVKQHTIQIIIDGIPVYVDEKQTDKILSILLGEDDSEGLLHHHKKYIKTGKYAGDSRYYTFSEDQLKHIHTLVDNSIYSLLKLHEHLGSKHRETVLDKLWDFRSTHNFEDHRNDLIRAIHYEKNKDFGGMLTRARTKEAKETNVLKHIIFKDILDDFQNNLDAINKHIIDFMITELREEVLEFSIAQKFNEVLLATIESTEIDDELRTALITLFILMQGYEDEYDKRHRYNFQPIMQIINDFPEHCDTVFSIMLSHENILEHLLEEIHLHTHNNTEATFESWCELRSKLSSFIFEKVLSGGILEEENHVELLSHIFANELLNQEESEQLIDYLFSQFQKQSPAKGKLKEFSDKIRNRITNSQEHTDSFDYVALLSKIYQYCNEPTQRYIQFQFMVRNMSVQSINS